MVDSVVSHQQIPSQIASHAPTVPGVCLTFHQTVHDGLHPSQLSSSRLPVGIVKISRVMVRVP